MKKEIAVAMVAIILLGAEPADAGIYSDGLAKCLVERTTEADKTQIIQWMFTAMSAHPAVMKMSNVTPEDRTRSNKQFAQLSQDLLAKRCRRETILALRYEGASTIESSFGVLGGIAMRGLMGAPAVVEQLNQIGGFVDKDTMTALATEASPAVVTPVK